MPYLCSARVLGVAEGCGRRAGPRPGHRVHVVRALVEAPEFAEVAVAVVLHDYGARSAVGSIGQALAGPEVDQLTAGTRHPYLRVIGVIARLDGDLGGGEQTVRCQAFPRAVGDREVSLER